MVTWTLLLYVGVALGKGVVSNSIATIPGFASQALCVEAGQESATFLTAAARQGNYFCVKVEGPSQPSADLDRP